jgi:hypothetical protein
MRSRPVWHVLSAALPLFAALSAEAQDPHYGVVASADLASEPRRQDHLFALGAGWVRVARSWDQIETAPGHYDWEQTDKLVAALTARGLNIYWDFSYAPGWANGNRRNNEPPKDQQALYTFVHAVVRRYGFERKQIQYWGTWNEPNLSRFYHGGVSRFVSHELPTTVNAIQAADPDAKIVVGELSSSSGAKKVGRFLKAILDVAGAAASVVSQHLYDGGDTCAGRLRLLDTIHSELVASKHGDLPLWVTETGLAAPESEKSRYLTCVVEGMKTRPWWQKTFWYRYEYERPSGSRYSFGLLDRGADPATEAPNPTYRTYQQLANPTAPQREDVP